MSSSDDMQERVNTLMTSWIYYWWWCQSLGNWKQQIYCSNVLLCKFADNLLFLGVKSIVLSGHVCDIRFCDCLPGMLASYTTITLLSALLHQKRFFRWFALNQAVSSFISKSAWSFISWNTASLLFCSQNILIYGISHSKQRVCFSSAKLRLVCCLSLSATTDRNLFPVQNCWKQRNSAPKRKNLVLSEI